MARIFYFLALFFFSFLPKSCLSFMAGWLARLKLGGCGVYLARGFAVLMRIDMSEAEPKTYRSIEDLFTRRLAHGARPVEAPVVSPADGTVLLSKAVTTDAMVQAKGVEYSIC